MSNFALNTWKSLKYEIIKNRKRNKMGHSRFMISGLLIIGIQVISTFLGLSLDDNAFFKAYFDFVKFICILKKNLNRKQQRYVINCGLNNFGFNHYTLYWKMLKMLCKNYAKCLVKLRKCRKLRLTSLKSL